MSRSRKKQVARILSAIENVEQPPVIDHETASKSDILKYRLCQEFIKILKQENITQAELARRLNVDKAIVNKIVLHKIDTFTIDRLIDLFSSIRPLEVLLKAI